VKLGGKLLLFTSALLLQGLGLAEGQQPKLARIGYISGSGSKTDQGPYVEALRGGLRDLGHVEGKTFSIEFRGAEGKLDRVAEIVTELVQSKVDVLVVPIPSGIRRAKEITKTIPIVIVGGVGEDLVNSGIVESLARPGGNITGIATLGVYLNGKRLELLSEAIPRLTRVAVLRHVDARPTHTSFTEYETAARHLKIKLQPLGLMIPRWPMRSRGWCAKAMHSKLR
jgi:putative ABC transport system substrate-binding protein